MRHVYQLRYSKGGERRYVAAGSIGVVDVKGIKWLGPEEVPFRERKLTDWEKYQKRWGFPVDPTRVLDIRGLALKVLWGSKAPTITAAIATDPDFCGVLFSGSELGDDTVVFTSPELLAQAGGEPKT